MKYSNELSVIDTEEKAYLLGQIYGDGYNCPTPEYKFSMGSINTDTPLYTKLSVLFPFLKLKTYASHSNMIYLENHEKALCKDLANHGMISNKTKNDVNGVFHFPKLREDLLPHFIRGYFDADGSAWYPERKRSRNNLHIEFGCSTKNFLLEIKKILDENGIYFTYTERKKRAGNGKLYQSYILFSSNYNISMQFANFIYKDATIYLDYKHALCYRPKILRPSAFSVYGPCPYCGSERITRMGVRYLNKRRLRCVDCNRRFTKINEQMPTQEETLDE